MPARLTPEEWGRDPAFESLSSSNKMPMPWDVEKLRDELEEAVEHATAYQEAELTGVRQALNDRMEQGQLSTTIIRAARDQIRAIMYT